MKWITRPEFSKFGHKLHTRYVLSKLKGVEDQMSQAGLVTRGRDFEVQRYLTTLHLLVAQTLESDGRFGEVWQEALNAVAASPADADARQSLAEL